MESGDGNSVNYSVTSTSPRRRKTSDTFFLDYRGQRTVTDLQITTSAAENISSHINLRLLNLNIFYLNNHVLTLMRGDQCYRGLSSVTQLYFRM